MLTPADIEQISKLVSEAVAASLKSACVSCNLSEPARNEMTHLMGMVKDIGGGGKDGYGIGIESMRENNKLLAKYRKRADKIGMAVIIFFCLTMAGGLFVATREGIKVILGLKGISE